MRDERGFALIAVLLVLALLAVVVTEFAFSARLEASMVRAYRDGVRGPAPGRGRRAAGHPRDPEPGPGHRAGRATAQLVFYRALPGADHAGARARRCRAPASPLGPGEFSYRISDEAARLGLNGADTARLDRLLAGARRRPASSATSSPTRSRTGGTPTSCTALHGAESDFYLRLPVPYRARNGNLQDATELLQIRGVTPRALLRHGRPPGAGRSRHRGHRQHREPQHRPAARPQGLSASRMPRSPTWCRRACAPPTRRCRAASRVAASRWGAARSGSRPRAWWAASRAAASSPWSSAARPGRALDVTIVSWRPGVDVMMPARIGLFLDNGRLTVVGVAGRDEVEHFVVEDAEDPAGTLAAELQARGLDGAPSRVGLDRRAGGGQGDRAAARGRQRHRPQMVGFDLERHVPFPPEDVRFDWLELPSGPTSRAACWWWRPSAARWSARWACWPPPSRRPAAVDGGLPRAARSCSRALPAQRAVWAHRHGAATDLLFLDGPHPAHEPPRDRGRRPEGLAREIRRSLALVRWTDCEAVWLSGDDAAGWIADLGRVARRPGLRLRRTPRPGVALVAALPREPRRGRPCSRSAWRSGPRTPPLNLLPAEARPWTPSREQLVTAGIVGGHRAAGRSPWLSRTRSRPSDTSGV